MYPVIPETALPSRPSFTSKKMGVQAAMKSTVEAFW